MATRFITLSLLTTTTKRSSGPAFRRSYTSLSLSTSRSLSVPTTNFPLLRLRYLYLTRGEIVDGYIKTLAAVVGSEEKARKKMYTISTRHYSAFGSPISKEVADRIIDLSRARREEPSSVIKFDKWTFLMKDPEGNPTRDEIIDSYIQTLAAFVGSEEEARKRIFLVSTKHYYGFGALISKEIAYKILSLPGVVMVVSGSNFGATHPGGEPFINGQAVPYDPKYHEAWVKLRASIVRGGRLLCRGEWVRRNRRNDGSQENQA